ncbi:helix-turn-helix transcriptional regulator [Brevibacillus laterosporus]|uniref:helix-turn-helix transcriptional regulator n=2 Tax=Brevibacillus TaxID=55080 RepID=UPI001F094509|nr:helix-turn-helix transcriptional regulator [Brevibacillus laterosporus]
MLGLKLGHLSKKNLKSRNQRCHMTFKVGRCRLFERLKIADMTQADLAEKIQMKRQQLSDYANNRNVMSLSNARSIAHALGCHIDDLYEWIEIPPSERNRNNNRSREE